MGLISPKHRIFFDFGDCRARNAPRTAKCGHCHIIVLPTQTPSPRLAVPRCPPSPSTSTTTHHTKWHIHDTTRQHQDTRFDSVGERTPDTTAQPRDMTTRRGEAGWGCKHKCDNDEDGDGPSCPSP